jgi:hypothetical protein
MADPSRDKRERAGKPTYEAEAQLLREKTARLRELRLEREAADAARAAAAGTPAAVKKKAGKTRHKGPSLSDWLATQQNEGRRG